MASKKSMEPEKKRTRRLEKKVETVEPETKETIVTDDPVEPDESKETEIDPKGLTPSEYFSKMKNLRKDNDQEMLVKAIDVCEALVKRFETVGQKKAAEKVMYKHKIIEKEIQLFNKGVTQYVLLEDVTKYVQQISSKNVFLIEIENFPRVIPDDVVDKWLEVRDIFDKGYIVFIDHTRETQKDVEKERKEKDPILFGAIKVTDSASMRGNVYEKLFFIADWVDEYCDLTFDKMVGQMCIEMGVNPIHKIELSDEESIRSEISGM